MTFYQPELEAALRDARIAYANVHTALGVGTDRVCRGRRRSRPAMSATAGPHCSGREISDRRRRRGFARAPADRPGVQRLDVCAGLADRRRANTYRGRSITSSSSAITAGRRRTWWRRAIANAGSSCCARAKRAKRWNATRRFTSCLRRGDARDMHIERKAVYRFHARCAGASARVVCFSPAMPRTSRRRLPGRVSSRGCAMRRTCRGNSRGC